MCHKFLAGHPLYFTYGSACICKGILTKEVLIPTAAEVNNMDEWTPVWMPCQKFKKKENLVFSRTLAPHSAKRPVARAYAVCVQLSQGGPA